MNDLIRVSKAPNGMLVVSGECVNCQNVHKIENVSEEGYNQYKRGEVVNVALPNMSIDDATFMTKGECPECQPWTDPAGGTHDYNDDDPAYSYI